MVSKVLTIPWRERQVQNCAGPLKGPTTMFMATLGRWLYEGLNLWLLLVSKFPTISWEERQVLNLEGPL